MSVRSLYEAMRDAGEPAPSGSPARDIVLPTVLVVEDDREIRQMVALYLRRAGLNVVTAADALEATRAIEIDRPDLMVLDVMMPGRDGFELLADLRLHGNQVPVVMLSALCTADDVALGMRLGADDYITKPFTRAELLSRVRRLVDNSRLDAAAFAFNELMRLASSRAPEGREPPIAS